MNCIFIFLAVFTIFSGCFCKIHPRKRFASLDVNTKNNLDTSTNKQTTTNSPNLTNTSFEILETDTEQPTISNKNEFDRSKIIISIPKNDDEQTVFLKWKSHVIGKMKNLLINFFNKLEEEQTDLNGIDNELESSNPNLKRRDINGFFKKARKALVETTKTALETTKNVAETVGESVKKITTRNTSSYNSTGNNTTGNNNVVDEDDLKTTKHICHHHCKDEAFKNTTILPVVSDDTKADIHGKANNFKIDNQTTVQEDRSTSSNNSNNPITKTSQLIKGEEETETISILEEQTMPNKIAMENENTAPDTNNNKEPVENDVIQEEVQISNALEEETTPDLLNMTKINLKLIDKNTKYFLGEETTEQTATTYYSRGINDKNESTEENKTPALEAHENTKRYRIINIKENKCKGNVEKGKCIENKNIHRKRSISKDNHNEEEKMNQTITETHFTPTSHNTSNQNAINNTSSTSVDSKSSKQVDRVTLKAAEPKEFFIYKDWLWKHLQSVKNSSVKSNSKENFFKTHHFLSNSGGTDKSTTAKASEFFTIFFENLTDQTDLAIDLNKIILENENLDQIPNVQQDLFLQHQRRIKRDASNKSKRGKKPRNSEVTISVDEPVDLWSGEEDEEDKLTNYTEENLSSSTENKTTVKITPEMAKNITVEPSSSSVSSPGTDTLLTEAVTETTLIINYSMISTSTGNDVSVTHQEQRTSVKILGTSDFDKEEPIIKVTVPQMNKTAYSSVLPEKRGHFEKEWNDGGGIRTKPLLLVVTVPSFIGMGVFILALCFLTRTGGWCCRLFNAQSRSRSTSQSTISRDVQEPMVTNRTKYYK